VALVGRFSSVAFAMITEHRELHGAAGGTGTGAGGAGAGAGAGGSSSAGGAITVWALTAQLLHALVCHERIRIDLEGAIVGELLGDRLWKVSLALLRRAHGNALVGLGARAVRDGPRARHDVASAARARRRLA